MLPSNQVALKDSQFGAEQCANLICTSVSHSSERSIISVEVLIP